MGTTTTTSTIAAYRAAGYSLFPCSRTKKPKEAGWQHTTPDQYTDAELGTTFGVVLGSDDLVLDVDPRRFKDNENQLTALWAELNLPTVPTLIVKTASGGYHVYLKKQPDVRVSSRVPGYGAIECKTKGQYVIGAGSTLGKDRAYTIVRGEIGGHCDAPQALMDKVFRESFDPMSDGAQTDDEGAKRRFVLYLMKTAPIAISGRGGDATTYGVACEGRDYGLDEETTYNLMSDYYNPRCNPPWDDMDLRKKVEHAYKYARGAAGALNPAADFGMPSEPVVNDEDAAPILSDIRWDLNENGIAKPTLLNALNYFSLPNTNTYVNPLFSLFRYNEFTHEIEFSRMPEWRAHQRKRKTLRVEDSDILEVKKYLNTRPFYPSTELVREAVVVIAQRAAYHPVKEYLKSLVWDKKPRLDYLLTDYAGAPDTAYVREVGKNTIIAAVARVFDPGCQHDHILVLEGRQGTGKSRFVRALGGKWYADIIIDTHNKDTVANMQGAWFIEASEMEFTRRSDVAAMKSFLTRVTDKVRPAYARIPIEFPRQSLFIGTHNPDTSGYLKDTTGNRRYWPVATSVIDVDGLYRDRDQIFAEAVWRYENGENWYIVDPALRAAAEQEQGKRVDDDIWEEVIEAWLPNAPDGLITSEAIAFYALHITPGRLRREEVSRISRTMEKLGYVRRKLWCPERKAQLWAWTRQQQTV